MHRRAASGILPPSNPFRARVQRMETEQRIQTILGLQRQIGNSATLALLRRGDVTRLNGSSRITVQRKSRHPHFSGGLATKGKDNDFAVVFFRQAHGENAAAMSIDEFLRFIQRLITGTLMRSQTAPLMKFTTEVQGDSYGSFRYSEWCMNINPEIAFGSAKTVSEITEANLKELADTVYHETRHAEQIFRVLRARVGAMLPDPENVTKEQRWAVADKLRREIAVPFLVALQAAEHPLSPDTKAGKRLLSGAMAWEKSIYGSDAQYRNFVLGKSKENAQKMYKYSSKLYYSVPDDYNVHLPMHNMPLPQKAADYDTALDWINSLYRRFESRHLPEAERVLESLRKRGKSSGMEQIMRRHIQTILSAMRAILKTEGKLYTKEQIEALYYQAEAAVLAFDQAYRDLPEEADAWRIGGKAGSKYEKQARKHGLDTSSPEDD